MRLTASDQSAITFDSLLTFMSRVVVVTQDRDKLLSLINEAIATTPCEEPETVTFLNAVKEYMGMPYGICLIDDGIEKESETGYESIESAVNEAKRRNANPPNRFDESGSRIYMGEWIAYRIGDGQTFK